MDHVNLKDLLKYRRVRNITEATNVSEKSKKCFDKKNVFESLPYAVGLILTLFIAFYIRIRPRNQVFLESGFIRFAENDPWYHWRNINYLLHNYPDIMWFDPYTTYPFGTNQAFAPLYDFIFATVVKLLNIFGLASTQEGAMTLAAYWPCFLAVLCVIAVYFTSKTIFNSRNIGLLAAFLVAVAPGQFLSRSIIGFNDHHVAEVLFSTMVMYFMVKMLMSVRNKKLTEGEIKQKKLGVLKAPLPYAVLTGITMALYTLVWEGALLFAFVIGVYITIQMIVNHLKDQENILLAVLGTVIFAIDFIIVLVTPQIGEYKTLHMIALVMGMLGIISMALISRILQKRNMKKWAFPGILAGLAVLAVVVGGIVSVEVYNAIIGIGSFFVRSGGATTIGEAAPFFKSLNPFIMIMDLFKTFSVMGILWIVALPIIAYNSFKENKTEENLFVVWSLVVLWAMIQQTRFSYYFGINVMILSAWLVIMISNKAGLPDFGKMIKKQISDNNLKIQSAEKVKNKKKIEIQKSESKKGLTGFGVLVVLIAVLLFAGIPTGNGYLCTYTLTGLYTEYAGGPDPQWVDACQWLNKNTPDPGLDMLGKYKKPLQDIDGDGIEDIPRGKGIEFYENKIGIVPFDYPEKSYGVMSWWDYGHWIEVIGKRMACANPFQFGVGGRRGSVEDKMIPGAAPFFVAETEKDATAVLEAVDPREGKAGARYIVTDIEMASGMSKFYAMTAWTLDTDNYYVQVPTAFGNMNVIASMRYYNSMVSRLHLFDTDGLEQYRMVFESETVKPDQRSFETVNKEIYNNIHKGNIKIENTGYVKIYEYVKGAEIKGTASPDTDIDIAATILTNQGRTFKYTQKTKTDASGNYSFCVPYSTTGEILQGETNYAVKPTGPYTINQKGKTIQVTVQEKDVLNGNTVQAPSFS